jgi:hypothetical protein
MILSNEEIYKINDKLKIKNLLVINKDDLKNIDINNYNNYNYNYIINIDKKNGYGTHWVAIYQNIYFDSYSLKPPNVIEDYFKNGYHMNDKQIQPLNNNSQYCGWLCLMFLNEMNKNKNINITNYMKFLYFLELFNYNNKNNNKKIIYKYFIDIIK